VTLSWGQQPRDLDLHLAIQTANVWASVNFSARGARDAFPWAFLDDDVRLGSGSETITVRRMLPALYRCIVHNFSADAPLAGCAAEVLVRLRDAQLSLTCPAAGSGAYWHVFDIAQAGRSLKLVNTIVHSDPTEPTAMPSQDVR
jgi:hypothetical protein